uniref:Uncharacterized protein n=1 Tax=Rhizopus microsporus virga-like virus 1 TaxID=3156536 RepID=A0AAT9H825_9VIRU
MCSTTKLPAIFHTENGLHQTNLTKPNLTKPTVYSTKTLCHKTSFQDVDEFCSDKRPGLRVLRDKTTETIFQIPPSFTLFNESVIPRDTFNFPEWWFYGAAESIPFLQQCAFKVYCVAKGRLDNHSGVFYDCVDDTYFNSLPEYLRVDVVAESCADLYTVMRTLRCFPGALDAHGVDMHVWSDLIQEQENMLSGRFSETKFDYSKFLNCQYLYALNYADKRFRQWVGIIFMYIHDLYLSSAVKGEIDYEMLRLCPYLRYRSIECVRKCNSRCNVIYCNRCIMRYRDEDMVRTFIGFADHRNILKYYNGIYEQSPDKNVSLRIELGNYVPLVSFSRWIAIMRFVAMAPKGAFNVAADYFFYTPRDIKDYLAFEVNSAAAKHIYFRFYNFAKDSFMKSIRSIVMDGRYFEVFDTPYEAMYKIRPMVFSTLSKAMYFTVNAEWARSREYFEKYGRQRRDIMNILDLKSKEEMGEEAFRGFEIDDSEIDILVCSSIVERRVTETMRFYKFEVFSFELKSFRRYKSSSSLVSSVSSCEEIEVVDNLRQNSANDNGLTRYNLVRRDAEYLQQVATSSRYKSFDPPISMVYFVDCIRALWCSDLIPMRSQTGDFFHAWKYFDRIITCYHNIKPFEDNLSVLGIDTFASKTVLSEADCIIMSGTGYTGSYNEMGVREPRDGERVVVLTISCTCDAHDTSDIDEGFDCVQVSDSLVLLKQTSTYSLLNFMSQPGDSGALVVSLHDFSVVGMLKASLYDYPGVSLMTNISDEIKVLLK